MKDLRAKRRPLELEAVPAIRRRFRFLVAMLVVVCILGWAVFHRLLNTNHAQWWDSWLPSYWATYAFLTLFLITVIYNSLTIRYVIRRAEKEYERLQNLEQWSRTLVERAADGIVTFDENGKIETFNPAAEITFACTWKEVVGQSIQRIIPGYSGIFDVVGEDTDQMTGVQREKIGRRWDGSSFYMDLAVSEVILNHRKVFMAIIHDISEKRAAEQALKFSEERFRNLVELSPDAIAIHAQGKITFINGAGVRLLGANDERDILGKTIWEFVPKDYYDMIRKRVEHMMTTGESVPLTEEKLMRLDGKTVDVELAAIPFTYLEKPAIQVVARDITQRKQAEQQIYKSLREKEVLLKEIQHRVKNNLQVISSLLDLQSDHVVDRVALEAIRECQSRLQSIGYIHEQLYQSVDLASIDFPGYISSLANHLLRTYGRDETSIEMKVVMTEIQLGLDAAVPCGLIVHELISNSLKHAFPNGRNGEIRVGLHADGDRLILVVADNGVGFPPGKDYKSNTSLGLQLVSTLVAQISGNLDFHSTSGTEYIITFPVSGYMRS